MGPVLANKIISLLKECQEHAQTSKLEVDINAMVKLLEKKIWKYEKRKQWEKWVHWDCNGPACHKYPRSGCQTTLVKEEVTCVHCYAVGFPTAF